VATAYCLRTRRSPPVGRHLDPIGKELACIEQVVLSLRAASAATCGSDSAPGFLWRADIGIDNAGEDYRVATFRFCAGQCPHDAAQYFCAQNVLADGQDECATQLAQAAAASAASSNSVGNPLASCDDSAVQTQVTTAGSAPGTAAAVDVSSSGDVPKLARESTSDRTRPQEPVAAQPSTQFGAMPADTDAAQGRAGSIRSSSSKSRFGSNGDGSSSDSEGTFGWRDGALLFGRLCGFLSPLFVYLAYLAQRIVSGSSVGAATHEKAYGHAVHSTLHSESSGEEEEELEDAAEEKMLPSPSSTLKAMLAECALEPATSSADSLQVASTASDRSDDEVDCASLEADLASAETAPVMSTDVRIASREMPDAAMLGASVRRLKIALAAAETRASKAEATLRDAKHALSQASDTAAAANAANALLQQRCKDAEAEVVALRNGLRAQVEAAEEANSLALEQQQAQHREAAGKLGLEVARWQQRAVVAETALQDLRKKASHSNVEEQRNDSPSYQGQGRSSNSNNPSKNSPNIDKNSNSKSHNKAKISQAPKSAAVETIIPDSNAATQSAVESRHSRRTVTQQDVDSSWAANVPKSPAAAGWSPEDDIDVSIDNRCDEIDDKRSNSGVENSGSNNNGATGIVADGHSNNGDFNEDTDKSAVEGSNRHGKAKLSAKRRKAAKAKAENDAAPVAASTFAGATTPPHSMQPTIPGDKSVAFPEEPSVVAPITTPPGLSMKRRPLGSSLPQPINTLTLNPPDRDPLREPVRRQKWGDAAVAMTPEPSPSHREQVLRNMNAASALLEDATVPQAKTQISPSTTTQIANQAVNNVHGNSVEESQTSMSANILVASEGPSSAESTSAAGIGMSDARKISAPHTHAVLNTGNDKASATGEETCRDDFLSLSVTGTASNVDAAEDDICKVESSTDELAAHLPEVEVDQRQSPLAGNASAMVIIGHIPGSSPDGVQYEVRWSAPGEATEDFWFERCELLSGGLGDALSTYDQAHGLASADQEPMASKDTC